MPLLIGLDLPPTFYGMGDKIFQQFSRDIIAKDAEVSHCEQYGVPGQTDHGVDLKAILRKDGLWLAQCKAYKQFSVAKIKKVSDEFFKHWETVWRDANVKRFTLILGCDVNNISQQKELVRQKQRFASFDISYEWWSASSLLTILKLHEEIVLRYCHPNPEIWVERICGKKVESKIGSAGDNSFQLYFMERLHSLEKVVASDSNTILRDAIESLKQGDRKSARSALIDLQNRPERWQLLTASQKADVVAFSGRLLLDINDIDAAFDCADDAEKIAATSSTAYLRSLCELRRNNFTAAKDALEGCSTEEACRIRVSIFIQEGKLDDAIKILDSADAVFANDSGELLRLKAVVLLLAKRVDEALTTVDKAFLKGPKYISIRLSSAVIRYYCALSPAEIPEVFPFWPAPVPWSAIKQNEQARIRLDEATNLFRQILEGGQLLPDEKKQVEGWLVASLASNTSRQAEAADYCKQLLRDDPGHEPAIAWSVIRKYAFDIDPSQLILTQKIADEQASTDHVIALLLILIDAKKFEDATRILQKALPSFERNNSQKLWEFWKLQIALLDDDEQVALMARNLSDVDGELISMFPQDVQKSFFQNENVDQLQGRRLLDYCTYLAQTADWGTLSGLGQRLVQQIQTPQALRLAAFALFETEQFEYCLRVINENENMFNGSILPTDLKMLQADCHLRLGLVNEALEKAEQAAVLSPNVQTLLHYSSLLAQTGSLRALVSVVERLARYPELSTTQALRLGDLIARDEPDLAKKLWHRATAKELKARQALEAITLAVKLGLDRGPVCARLYGVLQRVAKRKNQKYIRFQSLSELSQTMRDQRADLENRFKTYVDGAAPAHLLYDVPILGKGWSENSRSDNYLVDRSIGFCIHEDRKPLFVPYQSAQHWRIYCDLSSILIAYEFDFLDQIIEKFNGVVIPNATIQDLFRFRQQLRFMSDDRRRTLELLLDAISKGQIQVEEIEDPRTAPASFTAEEQLDHVFDELLLHVKASEGILVDNHPIRNVEGSVLTREQLALISGGHQVLTSLFELGFIDKVALDTALEMLPKSMVFGANPQKGQTVFCHLAFVEDLAKIDLLNQASQAFVLKVLSSEVEFASNELAEDRRTRELYENITRLIQKLSDEVQSERIYLLPQRKLHKPGAKVGFTGFCDLIELEPEPNAVLLIDDRYSNAHATQGRGMPLISTFDLLYCLGPSELGARYYFDLLNALRRANIRYIPILADELWYRIQCMGLEPEAKITPELISLRAYVAASACGTYPLRKTKALGPIAFSFGLKTSLMECWKRIWCAAEAFEWRLSRANWLIENMGCDPLSISLQSFHNADLQTVASIVAEMYFCALSIRRELGMEEAERYMQVLLDGQIGLLIRRESGFAKCLADAIRRFISAALAENEGDMRLFKAILSWWCERLPLPVREQLTDDTQFSELLGIRTESFVTYGDYSFPMDPLEKAIKLSINEFRAVDVLDHEQKPVLINASYDEKRQLNVNIAGLTENLGEYSELQFLYGNPAARQNVLNETDWIDARKDRKDAIIAYLTYLEPASSRAKLLDRYRDENASSFYSKLWYTIRSKERISFQDLLPASVEGLMLHYGFPFEGFSIAEQCRDAYINDVKCFSELISELPINLGDLKWLRKGVSSHSISELKRIVRYLLAHYCPVARIQLCKILEFRSDLPPVLVRLRRMICRSIISPPFLRSVRAYTSVLSWVQNRFAALPELRGQSPELLLTLGWCHSGNLYNVFKYAGLSDEFVMRTFETAERLNSVIIWSADSSASEDWASSPLTVERFISACAAYAFSREEIRDIEFELEALLVVHVDESCWPVPQLFGDFGRTNLLGTFLNVDLAHVIPAESALVAASSPHFSEIAQQCLESITSVGDPTFWWLILWHLAQSDRSRPIITQGVRNICRESSISDLLRQCKAPYSALLVMGTHCANDSEVSALLQKALIDILSNPDIYIDQSVEQDSAYRELFFAVTACVQQIAKASGTSLDAVIPGLIRLSRNYASYLHAAIEELWPHLSLVECEHLWKVRALLFSAACQRN